MRFWRFNSKGLTPVAHHSPTDLPSTNARTRRHRNVGRPICLGGGASRAQRGDDAGPAAAHRDQRRIDSHVGGSWPTGSGCARCVRRVGLAGRLGSSDRSGVCDHRRCCLLPHGRRGLGPTQDASMPGGPHLYRVTPSYRRADRCARAPHQSSTGARHRAQARREQGHEPTPNGVRCGSIAGRRLFGVADRTVSRTPILPDHDAVEPRVSYGQAWPCWKRAHRHGDWTPTSLAATGRVGLRATTRAGDAPTAVFRRCHGSAASRSRAAR